MAMRTNLYDTARERAIVRRHQSIQQTAKANTTIIRHWKASRKTQVHNGTVPNHTMETKAAWNTMQWKAKSRAHASENRINTLRFRHRGLRQRRSLPEGDARLEQVRGTELLICNQQVSNRLGIEPGR